MKISAQAASRWAPQDVSADTDPESAFWRDAPAVFADKGNFEEPLPAYGMTVFSRWTEQNLYFLFVCPYVRLHLKPDPRTDVETNELWHWDVTEVFIGAGFDSPRKYKEFEVSPQGEWVDLDVDLDRPRHEDGWTWVSNCIAAARIDPARKIWYAFLRIPYTAIDASPAAAGNRLRVNFFRSEGPEDERISVAWQPTCTTTFHTPETFGILTLTR